MAFSSDGEGAGSVTSRRRAGAGAIDGQWAEPTKPERDLKKLALIIGLGTLSWVATYVGMLELIEANMGDLPLVHKAIIGFSVAMLMTMVVWLLDQLFQPIGFFLKSLYAAGYIFLTVISVGFGFGFYWKALESRSESSRSAESAVTQVQGSLNAASTRLEQLQATLAQLTQVSQQKAESERATGLSCPNSKPGDGPRRKMREDDAARFGFAAEFVKGRVGAVKGDMAALDVEFAKIAKDDKSTIDAKSGTRNEFMKGLSRRLDMTVTSFNAFRTDPQLKQIRSDLAERAEKVAFVDTKGSTYTCPDAQLQTALRGVVRAIDQLPEMEKPRIAAVEGSEATIEAFRRLTATFYGLLSFKLPPSADELRELQKKAVQSVEGGAAQTAKLNAMAERAGLSKRDYVPLAIAIFVDICLLLVSMGRSTNRLASLVPKMQAAEKGPVYQILSKFSDIHKDPETREKFEIFRHVVFDFNGDYYVAVPLNAPVKANPQQKLDLQLEAHLLANLFSSFEKERIFSRVHSPFLTTGTIQKKLWRQGSKFAGSEAFRIYRFRDGAWSEIILGAVMGAARRVDSEKRRRTQEDGHQLPLPEEARITGRALPDPGDHSIRQEDFHPDRAEAHGRGHTGHAAFPQGYPNGYANRHAGQGADGETTYPPYSHNGYRSGRVSRAADRSQRSSDGGRSTLRREAMPADPASLARQFGPYADRLNERPLAFQEQPAARKQPPSANYREMAEALAAVGDARHQVAEAEVSVQTAANNNTAPHTRQVRAEETAPGPVVTPGTPAAAIPMPAPQVQQASPAPMPPASDNVVPLPRILSPRASEDASVTSVSVSPVEIVHGANAVDVTVHRETATFRVPVSEASLPLSLLAAHASRKLAQQQADADAVPASTIEKISLAMIDAETPAPGNALAVIQPAPRADSIAVSTENVNVETTQRYAGQPAE
jgi:hypothetical protein